MAHQTLASHIEYSEKYHDAMYEYRHVILPKELVRSLARDEFNKIRLQSDPEWRGVGIQMSRGWQHYALHRPEKHILLFRRKLGTDGTTGLVNDQAAQKAREQYRREYEGDYLA